MSVQHPEQAPGRLAAWAGCKQATAQARVAHRAYGHIHLTLSRISMIAHQLGQPAGGPIMEGCTYPILRD
jgi:hypothetical protein